MDNKDTLGPIDLGAQVKENNKKGNWWFGSSIVLFFILSFLNIQSEAIASFSAFVITAVCMWGCSYYAKAHGHSRWWGIIPFFIFFLSKRKV